MKLDVSSPSPILRALGLRKAFLNRDGDELVALDAVDLELYPGEIVALIGESGSGKTTLGRAILRLLTLDSGQIYFGDMDLLSLKGKALRDARKDFQMIFQNQQANLHPNMSVIEMIDESLQLHRPELDLDRRLKLARQLLEQVGLSNHEDRYLASLSGGEQRRVGLSRILATTPKLIVADEPTSGLDAAIKLQIIELLKKLKAESTYLLISHDLNLVKQIADRVLVMLRGQIIEEVPTMMLGKVKHHPYTEMLLWASLLTEPKKEKVDTEGHTTHSIEDIDHQVEGCKFVNTCVLARELNLVEHCKTKKPTLKSGEDEGHRHACWGINHD